MVSTPFRTLARTSSCVLLLGSLSLGCEHKVNEAPAAKKPSAASPAKANANTNAENAPQKPAKTKESRGLAWKLESKGRTLYLVGSVHVGTPDLYPMPTAIDAAFEDSTILVEEIDIFESKRPEKLAFMAQAAAYTPGDTLDKHLSPEVAALYEKSPSAALFGPAGQTLRPWFLSIAITMQALESKGYLASLGIDQHFADRAKNKEMKYEALETVESQLAALSGLPEKTQELMLKDTLEQMPKLTYDIEKTLKAWRAGDDKTVESIMMDSMRKPEYRPVYDALFLRRNENMKKAIDRYLSTKATEFVVVGSGHLLGPDGLVKTLAAEGRTIERLN